MSNAKKIMEDVKFNGLQNGQLESSIFVDLGAQTSNFIF